MINYERDLMIWSTAYLKLIDISHRRIIESKTTEYFEYPVFFFVMGKNGRIQIDDIPYNLKSNFLMHIAANQCVQIDSTSGELEFYTVAYHAKLPQEASRNMLGAIIQDPPFETFFGGRMNMPGFFMKQFSQLYHVWREPSPLNRLKIKGIFYDIIHKFYHQMLADQADEPELDIFEKARLYLQEHFDNPESIQQLADRLGVHRGTLHNQFKLRMGLSPQQYIMQLRLDRACTALSEGLLTIDEIAASCGLRDKSYFSRVFKQKFGIPPGAYRKKFTKLPKCSKTVKKESDLSKREKQDNFLLIKNFGRIHRYYNTPQRIVCLDYSAAEICAALGVADRISGVASAECALSDCAGHYREVISKATFLHGRSPILNVPSFKAVCCCRPELIIGSSYSFNELWGVAEAESFERLGIHVYALKATYTLDSNFSTVYEDIDNLGRILGVETRAQELISKMKDQQTKLVSEIEPIQTPLKVFVFDCIFGDQVLTSGQSLEDHMIRAAGGVNVFGDRASQFVAVNWKEIQLANPEAIIVHRFYDKTDSEQKVALLKRISEIAHLDAMRYNRIYELGIKKVFPGIDNVETSLALAQWFRSIAS